MADEIKVEYYYKWKINNFSMCYRKHEEALKSPVFTPNHCGGSKWCLEFYPLGRNNKGFVSCVLSRCDKDLGADEISVAFNIEIFDRIGNVFATRGNDTSKYDFKRGTRFGWDDLNLFDWKEDHITIGCRIINFFPAVSGGVTHVEVDLCSFNWTLDFRSCLADGVARQFSFSKASKYEISVAFPNEEIDIKISKLKRNAASKYVCGKIYLLNNLGVKVLSKIEKHLFDASEDSSATWNYPSFILSDQLEQKDNKYLKNGAFSLFCEFSEASGKVQCHAMNSIDSYFMAKLSNIVTLHNDFKDIFSNMKYSDIELKVENVTIPAHKILLVARSPVFSVMFNQDMVENKLNIVEIPDVDVPTLKSFLKFLYTGIVKFEDFRNALKLMMAANKYQVVSLEETCTEYLIPALTVENVCEILCVADMMNLDRLKYCALDFIAKHSADVANSLEWTELIKTNAELSADIFKYFATHYELKKKN